MADEPGPGTLTHERITFDVGRMVDPVTGRTRLDVVPRADASEEEHAAAREWLRDNPDARRVDVVRHHDAHCQL